MLGSDMSLPKCQNIIYNVLIKTKHLFKLSLNLIKLPTTFLFQYQMRVTFTKRYSIICRTEMSLFYGALGAHGRLSGSQLYNRLSSVINNIMIC